MKKLNLINAATVLAGAASGGLITMSGGTSNLLYISLGSAAGAITAIVVVVFDKTA